MRLAPELAVEVAVVLEHVAELNDVPCVEVDSSILVGYFC
jgi:hypothetical protein